ncbi:hypothetical protein B0A80_20375 [Flavobacterium tructae]|nr:hypothetical protein B0A80_20375 [Flavobacterium tructae]
MSNSIMRTKDCSDIDYGTVLVTNAIFGLCVYLLVIVLSPFITHFYNIPKLAMVLPVYGIGILFSSIKSVYAAYLMKNFNYKRMFLLNIPGSVISSIIAIILSQNNYGIWSIIYLFLVNQFISLVLFILFSGWKTIFVLDKNRLKKHFNFGYKISISSFINTLFENLYQLMIGKYFSIRMTGIFDRSYSLGNYPISILSTVLSKVTLPLFVNYVDDIDLLRQKFRESIKLVFFATSFVVGTILIVIPYMIRNFMGIEWIESIDIFRIICLGLLLYPIHSMNMNVLNVYGRSDILLKLEFIKKVLQIFLIFLLYRFGITGLVYSLVIHSYISLFINLYYTKKFIGYSILNQILDLIPTMFGGVICFLIADFLFEGYQMNIYLINFQLLIFLILFYFSSFFLNKTSFKYIREILFVSMKKIKTQ